jgi:NAD(P)-dependent dehydrogenase (short-subunit alcohol dehydrogenase family)
MKILENKIALVTGAGSGIGREIAYWYAREGAKVVVSDMDELGGNITVEHIVKAGGISTFINADNALPHDNERLVHATVEQYGGLHIACNNAGIGGLQAITGDYSIEGWDKVIAVNLSGVFYGMRYQIPAILKSGGGSIVNISSILGKVGFAMSPAYVAAKHGLVGLSEVAALEYSSQNIRINSVGPGFIKTPLLDKNLSKEMLDYLITKHPIGRLGEASEVAELVGWLSSDKASFVTGSYYAIDGGYLSQ